MSEARWRIETALSQLPDEAFPRPQRVQIDPDGVRHLLNFSSSEHVFGQDRTEEAITRLLEAEAARRLAVRLPDADAEDLLDATEQPRPTLELARRYRRLVLIHPEHAQTLSEAAASFERLEQLCIQMPQRLEVGQLAVQVARAIVGSSGVDVVAAIRAARARSHGSAAEPLSEYAEHLAALVRALPTSDLARPLGRDQGIERIQGALRVRWEEQG